MDVIERALKGEQVSKIKEVDHATRYAENKYLKDPLSFGAEFLRDCVSDGILDVDSQHISKKSEDDGYSYYVKVINTFSINPDFKKSRLDIDRIELITSDNGLSADVKCPVCGGTMKSGWSIKTTEAQEKERYDSLAKEYVNETKKASTVSNATINNESMDIKKYISEYFETGRCSSLSGPDGAIVFLSMFMTTENEMSKCSSIRTRKV